MYAALYMFTLCMVLMGCSAYATVRDWVLRCLDVAWARVVSWRDALGYGRIWRS